MSLAGSVPVAILCFSFQAGVWVPTAGRWLSMQRPVVVVVVVVVVAAAAASAVVVSAVVVAAEPFDCTVDSAGSRGAQTGC